MRDLLTIVRVSKHFGGVAALNDCTMSLAQGRVTGIIGPNGAGKTTLLNVVSGIVKPDRGSIGFDGRVITALAAHQTASVGLVRTFQIARELGGLTVLENLLLGAPP